MLGLDNLLLIGRILPRTIAADRYAPAIKSGRAPRRRSPDTALSLQINKDEIRTRPGRDMPLFPLCGNRRISFSSNCLRVRRHLVVSGFPVSRTAGTRQNRLQLANRPQAYEGEPQIH